MKINSPEDIIKNGDRSATFEEVRQATAVYIEQESAFLGVGENERYDLIEEASSSPSLHELKKLISRLFPNNTEAAEDRIFDIAFRERR